MQIFEAFMDAGNDIAVSHRDKDIQRFIGTLFADDLFPDLKCGCLFPFSSESIVTGVAAVPAVFITGFNGKIKSRIIIAVNSVEHAAALVLGAVIALVYTIRGDYTKSFVVTLALLPAMVTAVILMVSGSLGAGVAVAGTFSLVRFRSAPGSAREIGAVFLSMAAGLACGMGCPLAAAVLTLAVSAVYLGYMFSSFGEKRGGDLRKTLQITVPEDLEYGGIFDDLFSEYTTQARMTRVKTTNLGSLNRLTYEITLRRPGVEKAFLDALRCRNGNLEISLAERSAEGCEL